MSTDCRIAWVNITLPNGVSNDEAVDDWWPLSGKLGEEQEGTVHLLLSKKVCGYPMQGTFNVLRFVLAL